PSTHCSTWSGRTSGPPAAGSATTISVHPRTRSAEARWRFTAERHRSSTAVPYTPKVAPTHGTAAPTTPHNDAASRTAVVFADAGPAVPTTAPSVTRPITAMRCTIRPRRPVARGGPRARRVWTIRRASTTSATAPTTTASGAATEPAAGRAPNQEPPSATAPAPPAITSADAVPERP